MPWRAESLPPPNARIWGRGRGFAGVALLPPAAFAVHQLRYILAFGGRAGAELQETGHSYLHSVVPWLVLLLALAAGGFLRALARAFAGHASTSRHSASLAGLWLACSASLVAIFAGQEFLEGLFAAGHPAGLAGIFGEGGWWAIPAALCVGFVLAALLHATHWVVRQVAKSRTRTEAIWIGRAQAVTHRRDAPLVRFAPLIAGWSDRGPPPGG
jgi:hypothetical protein